MTTLDIFSKFYLKKYVESIPHILPYGLNHGQTLAHSITLSLNYIFHDCVSTDTALLDVMYVEIEDRSSDRNKHKHTQHNYTSRQVVFPTN
jgi:hypothetical protein